MRFFEYFSLKKDAAWAGVAALALLLVAGCARLSPPQEMDWSPHYGSNVIGEGFDTIAERYLEPVSVPDLALHGLGGLQSVDPGLTFGLDKQSLIIRHDGIEAGRIPAPEPVDTAAWSDATVAAIDIARNTSPALHEAKAESIFRAVFDAALAPLDRFSRYADAATATENRALRDGFGGIGVTIRMEDHYALIIDVNENGPARRAGLMPEDRVTHVDGRPIAGWTQRQLVEVLRGYVGTPVSLTVERAGKVLDAPVSLVRNHIVPQTVTLRRDGALAVIRISSFNQDTATHLNDVIAEAFAQPGPPPTGFVLDMRSNPGGLLNRAVEVVDVFVERGQIIATRGRHQLSIQSYPASAGDATAGRPLVVLINGNSASAAEVVAAALQDLGRAVIVGTNSFGKGTVQSVVELPNDGELTLTWSRLLAPSGYRLHGLGVLPTLCTHGGGVDASADSIIGALRGGTLKTTSGFALWRASVASDIPQRLALRNICPADGNMPATDMEVARSLIEDPVLYSRALRLSGTSVAQR